MKRARIIAFPFARRRGLILRLAEQMVAQAPAAAQKYLQQQLRRQIGALHRKQVPDRTVEREIRALESAVRAELWRLVLSPSVTPSGAAQGEREYDGKSLTYAEHFRWMQAVLAGPAFTHAQKAILVRLEASAPLCDLVLLPTMATRLLAFPLARRHALVKKLAGQLLDRSPLEAKKHLAFELSRHRRLLGRWQLSEVYDQRPAPIAPDCRAI